MKTKEIRPEEIQVIIAEKLKAILIKLNGKPSMSFKYQEKTDEHVDLVVTWNNQERCKTSKTFISLELGISVLDIKGADAYLISLRDIIQSPSHHKIAEYYKKNVMEIMFLNPMLRKYWKNSRLIMSKKFHQ